MYQKAMRSMTTVRLAVVVVATVVAAMAIVLTVAAQTPAEVAGTWELTGSTDNGPFTSTVMLEQNGTELTGHYSSEAVGEADVKGSVSGKDFTWSLSLSQGGYDIELTYTCTLQDDGTLTGQLDLGGAGGGSFTGKRK